jgi:hypothetical protein
VNRGMPLFLISALRTSVREGREHGSAQAVEKRTFEDFIDETVPMDRNHKPSRDTGTT